MKKRMRNQDNPKKQNKNTIQLDDYSLLCHTLSKAKLSKYDSSNEYYWFYIKQYIQDHLSFKLNRFYGFNFVAFFFGPLFYMYNAMYGGLFVSLLLTLFTFNLIDLFAPFLLGNIPIFLIGNMYCALLANYFVILKHRDRIYDSLKYTKELPTLLDYVGKLNTKYKFLNLLGSIPAIVVIFYSMFFITNPTYFTNPVKSIQEINNTLNDEMSKFDNVRQERLNPNYQPR